MNNELFTAADHYIDSLFPIDKDVLAVGQSIAGSQIPDMSVSSNQGRFLHVLAKLANAKRILEIGTFLGYSTIWLAKALPEDGHIFTLESDETNASIAQKNIVNAGVGPLVSIRIGKALEILPAMESEGAGPFDMIFIDADKPPYAEYFQWALRLSRSGTLIVADNVIRHVFDERTPAEKKAGVERFNKLLAECPLVTAVIIQNVGIKEPDGMAIAVVK